MTTKMAKRTRDRLVLQLRKYQRIVSKLRERDISEADTVTVVKDILSDLFGYDKYIELTSEQQIRGTFCDLAIKVEGKTYYLAEVKAAGINLNDTHLRQAVNYGANEGIEWVILTNAIEWRVYRIKFAKPIDYECVFAFDICGLSMRKEEDIELLGLLCREHISSDALTAFHQQAQIVNRHVIAQFLRGPASVAMVRKEIRRLWGIKVSDEEVERLIVAEVLKRDAVDGDASTQAASLIKKAMRSIDRAKAKVAG